MIPQKKSGGFKSGDHGGHSTDPPRPIYHPPMHLIKKILNV